VVCRRPPRCRRRRAHRSGRAQQHKTPWRRGERGV